MDSSASPLDLSIIIVNFNGGTEILRALSALRRVSAELRFEVRIVDNASTDGSAEKIAAGFPEFHIESAGKNLGFAAGCNHGLKHAIGRHFMLLNPDTEIRPGALRSLVEALDQHATWGIVGARMLTETGESYRAARRFPQPFDLFCECVKLNQLFPTNRWFSRYFYGNVAPEELDEVDQVEGSALMISGKVRAVVGDLDERFFVFFEEVDWCRRVRNAGYEIHVVQMAEIVHHRSTTMSKFYRESRLYNAASACHFFEKWEGKSGVRRLKRWMIPALWIREWGVRLLSLVRSDQGLTIKATAARSERKYYQDFRCNPL